MTLCKGMILTPILHEMWEEASEKGSRQVAVKPDHLASEPSHLTAVATYLVSKLNSKSLLPKVWSLHQQHCIPWELGRNADLRPADPESGDLNREALY